ncbi:MAG: WYL domain-containing protein [Gammaproteobacteria bacterium]|nr:WYL domain-containing protein [Gammaproteobacteria bacterium]
MDLRHYRDSAGDNIKYDATRKQFIASKNMKPQFLEASANRLLLQLRAFVSGTLNRDALWFRQIPPVGIAPELVRDVRNSVLRKVLKAIRTQQSLSVYYQSLRNSRWRDIAPHALVFDGYRWHTRAFCCERQEFRDFVLTRIERLRGLKPVSFDARHDLEWNRMISLKLCPHPGLTEEQSQAIQRDFGMRESVREIRVRLSLAYYFIKRMNLDLDGLEPTRAQIRLNNLSEVEEAIQSAKEESRRLVQAQR